MDLKLDNSENMFMTEIEKLNRNDINKIKKHLKEESNKEKYKKILTSLEFLVEGQKVTQRDLQLGLIGLAKQNSELLDLNKELNQQLEIVVSELTVIKNKREEKDGRSKNDYQNVTR